MKNLPLLLALVLTPLLLPAETPPKPRDWTSTAGSTLRATAIALEDDTVTLKREDGSHLELRIEQLVEEDRALLLKQFPPPPPPPSRKASKVEIKKKKNTTLLMEVPAGPYLVDGWLTIYPGEEIHLEFQEVDGKLAAPEVVPEVKYPKRTITFKMTQDAEVTICSRTSKMRQAVAMRCEHSSKPGGPFHPTNLRPTEKGLAAYDSWPSTVTVIRVGNFLVTDRPAADLYDEIVSGKFKGGEPKDDPKE